MGVCACISKICCVCLVCVTESVPPRHHWYADALAACVFILFSAPLVSVQTVINIIICCTYMTADISNLFPESRQEQMNLNRRWWGKERRDGVKMKLPRLVLRLWREIKKRYKGQRECEERRSGFKGWPRVTSFYTCNICAVEPSRRFPYISRSASLITFFHPAEEPLSILPTPTLSNNNPSQASSTSPKQTKKPLINIVYIYKSSLNAELCCGYGRHSPRAWQSSHCVSPRENLHNTYRGRDRPPLWQQTTRAKINCSSFLCLSLSSYCLIVEVFTSQWATCSAALSWSRWNQRMWNAACLHTHLWQTITCAIQSHLWPLTQSHSLSVHTAHTQIPSTWSRPLWQLGCAYADQNTFDLYTRFSGRSYELWGLP